MTRGSWGDKVRNKGVLVAYVLMILAALAFDISGDRSFGALMLSALPISFVAMVCLLTGPWRTPRSKCLALINWVVGATSVLLITLLFSSLGDEQQKAGELVFFYSILILSFPLSVAIPFEMALVEPVLRGYFIFEVMFAWVTCMMVGGGEWLLLCWVHKKIASEEGRVFRNASRVELDMLADSRNQHHGHSVRSIGRWGRRTRGL